MIFTLYPVLAFSWGGLFWAIIGCIIAFLALLMIISIVFLQDSKDAGLGGAFGSAGGSDALLGAGGQKGIVKVTAIISMIFAVLIIAWGMADMPDGVNAGSNGVDDGGAEAELLESGKSSASTGAGTSLIPGLETKPATGNTGGTGTGGTGGADNTGGAGGSSDGGGK